MEEKMNNFFEELKTYLSGNSREEFLESFKKYDLPENNVGPSMDDFIFGIEFKCLNHKEPYRYGLIDFNSTNPKATSGFLFNFGF
jgi:hypothetical protein